MRVLVVSDSHGNASRLCELYRQLKVSSVIFLGDGLRDADELSCITGCTPVYRVRGNCDFFDVDARDELLLELGGKRVFMTHGHRYGVKSGYDTIENIARSHRADIVLFGHTHIRFYENRDGLVMANPGAFNSGRYGILTIDRSVTFEHGEIYG